MSDAQERFRNIRLQEEYDMHDPKDPLPVVLPFLRKRSKIIEILAAQEIVLALDNRVFVQHLDGYSSLKCRSTSIEYIRRGKLDAGFAIFESESLKWPGFVEFDDINGKILTYSAQDSIYKVFDLKDYTMLFSISDKNVQEIKISPGIMLLIFAKASSHVPLKILSIEDGHINVSNILTGKCLAKIRARDGFPVDALKCTPNKRQKIED